MLSGGRKQFYAVLAAALIVAAVGAVTIFNVAISGVRSMVFDANSASLEETYNEVNANFTQVSHARWNYLNQLAQYLELAGNHSVDAGEILERIQGIDYGNTEFYFLSDSGSYMTLQGDRGSIDLGSALFTLMDDGENIVVDGSLPHHDSMVFYAVPTSEQTYNGFTYRAIAFGYNKTDISNMFTIDSYEGMSESYIIYNNGRVIFSLGNSEGSTSFSFSNLYTLLGDATLEGTSVDDIKASMDADENKTFLAIINGTEYYINYQPITMDKANLVSFTPASIVNRQMNNISNTMATVIGCFVGAAAILVVVALALATRRAIKNRAEREAEKEIAFSLISNDMDAVYILLRAIDLGVIYVSPSIERLLGVGTEDLYANSDALNPCIIDHPDTTWAKDLIRALSIGETKRVECQLKNIKTGKVSPYTLEVFRPEGIESNFYLVALADRTEEERVRRSVEDALEVARMASESKSNFLANMSHDIRTPMNAILGFTGLIQKNPADTAKVTEYAGKIDSAGQHLLGLINEVLDMSKIEAGKTELDITEVGMRSFCENIISVSGAQARQKGLEFKQELDIATDPQTFVYADRTRLGQILFNILSNAIKYTDAGGTVVFSVSGQRNVAEGFARYKFVITDTGMGMSPEFLETIWTPFSREETEVKSIQGTGLGMAITKNLVDLMGGTIKAESEQGKGSKFSVWLEFKIAYEAEEHSAAEEAEADAISLKGLSILAAEDNELNAELLTDLLDLEGATVHIEPNGKEVVRAFEASKPGQYDFILMDVQMPFMNGYEATRAIRESGLPHAQVIPIIAMTANAFTEDVANALESGMNAHLSKPIDMIELKKTVSRVLSGGGDEL